MFCACSTVFFERHLQYRRWPTDCEGASFYTPSLVACALPDGTCEFSLRVIDVAQGWSDTVTGAICPRRPPGHGGMRLHPCQIAFCSRTRVPSRITSRRPLQRCWRGNRTPFQHFTKNRSFTKNSSCCRNLATNWQPLCLQSGLGFAVVRCTQPRQQQRGTTTLARRCCSYFCGQSAWRQPILTLAHSALPV